MDGPRRYSAPEIVHLLRGAEIEPATGQVDKANLVGVAGLTRGCAARPCGPHYVRLSSRFALLGVNRRPLPPEGIWTFISSCY